MPDNVEIVRRVIEEFRACVARGDPGAVFDSEYLAPDAEWVPAMDVPGFESAYRGRDSFAAFIHSWTEQLEWSIDLDDVIDLGSDRVLAFVHQQATGKASRASVERHMTLRCELENGRVTRIRNFLERDKAFEPDG
jgi:ketosteroid isomerase-like protein